MSKSRRYGWSLALKRSDPRVKWLSPRAQLGLDYAQMLARAALARRKAGLAGEEPLPEPPSVARLAADEETSASEVNRSIKQARVELFGRDLSDSGIYYRLRTRQDGEPRFCAEPGCSQQVPTVPRRRYCARHGSGAARVRRHRRNARHPPAG